MSLYLVESTHQEQLAEALIQHMKPGNDHDFDRLDPTTVVVQNAGLGRWLRLWHARECGISAAVKMPFAQSFIAKELEAQGYYDRWQGLEPVTMRWQLFDLLQARAFDSWPDAGPLTEYLNPDHSNVERRAWQLAGRLADLYDSYAVHRPEWVTAWRSGDALTGELAHLQWQAKLFCAMVEQMGLSAEDLDRRVVGLALQHFFAEGASASEGQGPLHVFGITSFPPAFLKFFQQLAASREVYLYHLIPSEAYLGELPKNYRASLLAELESGDINSGEGADLLDNSLLVANGQAAARFQSLLLALDYQTGEMPHFATAEQGSDLLHLQNALRMNEPHCDFSADGSFSVHRCHSRIREVQVLQQQLLAQFAADPNLQPEEIIVLVPEISDYTDAIQSVFGMGTRPKVGANALRIPFCIADQKSSGDENCWRFFTALLNLLTGRQHFSEVACLLDFDPVCQRLGLDREVLKDLLNVLQAVGIRWGIDGAQRKAAGLPEYEAYSWDYGLQRLYDGLIFGESGPADRAPYATDSRMLEAVGSLTQFLRPVFELAARSREQCSFREWSEALIAVLRQILGSESQDGGEWMRLLASAIGGIQVSSTDTEIGFDTFCMMLEESDFAESGPSGLLRRGVTFCRLQPARHIPAKVVCILGLDEGSYPRQEKSLEFDLIDLQCRHAKALRGTDLAYRELHYLGDSHVRDEDRQLFLDCLLNARERLYLSYVGQSDLSNEELPPSLLVSELRQFLERVPSGSETGVKSRKKLVDRVIVRHPLQEWSQDNFKQPQPKMEQPPVPVHFNAQFATVEAPTERVRPFLDTTAGDASEVEGQANVTAVQLLRFLKDPAKDYISQQLHVKPDELDWIESHEDQESLALDSLESWSLRKKVFERWLMAKQQGQLTDQFAAQLKRQWQLDLTLPIGHAGETVWSTEVCPVLDTLEVHLGDVELRKSAFNLVCSDVHYQNEYWETTAGQRLIFINGELSKPKYLLEAFIHHVGSENGSLILSLKEQNCTAWPAFHCTEEGSCDVGRTWLTAVLALWRRGQATALPFSMEIAQEYVQSIRKDPAADPKVLLTNAYNAKWKTWNGQGQDCSEAQCLCFDDESPACPESSPDLLDEFASNAECILEPVLAWREQMNPKKGGK
jgi:exodeoxyribonuclease V gamma subunit